MQEFLKSLFISNWFIPYGHCDAEQPNLVWLHIISDIVIALAYYSIPILLVYFVRNRQEVPFAKILLMFSIFIIACGIIDLIDAPTLWHPIYGLSGFVKAIAAVVSLYVVAILSTGEDTIERKQAEEALRTSEQRLAGILDIAQDAIISINQNQSIQLFNQGAENIFGYKAAEVLGQPLDILLPERFAAAHRHYIRDFQHSGEVARKMGERSEVFGRRKDGTEFPAEASISCLQLHEQVIFTVILRDITKRKLAEAALQQQSQRLETTLDELTQTQAQLIQTEKMSSLGQMVAGVAHEINNPVNFIYANVSHARQYKQNLVNLLNLYQKYYPQPVSEILAECEEIDLDFLLEDLPKLLSSIQLGATRIRQIVLSLRNFSRLDEAEMKEVDIHEGIDSALLILQHRLRARPGYPGIEVIKEYGNLPEVECYPGQLNQVFMNVLTNAIDALEMGTEEFSQSSMPTISIHTQVLASNQVKIQISDNGVGMTEEVKIRIFDPFFTTKPVGTGTGLGLSITYKIVVEKHKGKLQCLSELGQGTEFIILLPIRQ